MKNILRYLVVLFISNFIVTTIQPVCTKQLTSYPQQASQPDLTALCVAHQRFVLNQLQEEARYKKTKTTLLQSQTIFYASPTFLQWLQENYPEDLPSSP